MVLDRIAIKELYMDLPKKTLDRLKISAKWIVQAKESGKRIVAVLGSGPNIHEGVTTLIAELMHKGIIDGVSTSSAVINHEMGGTLEKVKRVEGTALGFERASLPSDGFLEVSVLPEKVIEEFKRVIPVDMKLYRKMRRAGGDTIIKVAGNIAYPSGLFTERVSRDILKLSEIHDVPFEAMAGLGADPMTMIGAGAELNIPVLVTVPQLIGGGEVGLSIGDSLSISERCNRIARLMDSADVIIESAVALSQEIHDGPFERFTGHGIWADWEGGWTYSLADKKIIRLDLDPNLEKAWSHERRARSVSMAVHKGIPKTKEFQIPFRMEMSGFSRIPGSLPVIGDIGVIWPLLATMVADDLGISLDFMCYKQSTPAGRMARGWIVKNIHPVNRDKIFEKASKIPPGLPLKKVGKTVSPFEKGD